MGTHTTIAITVLSDNRAAEGLASEHGFALWIEAGGRRILFDTGQGAAMTGNAAALGVDLSRADVVALSHGHYDHTGNLPEVLGPPSQAQLYLHPEAVCDRYSIHAAPKRIGMPAAAVAAVMALPESRRHWATAPAEIAEGVWLTGAVPRQNACEDTGGPFFKDPQGQQSDEIADDLALWIQSAAGIVICLGCCHAGVINTLDYICKKADDTRIAALLGGMHLLHAAPERLAHTAEALQNYAIPCVIPCHCTGEQAGAYLRERLGASVRLGYAGMTLQF